MQQMVFALFVRLRVPDLARISHTTECFREVPGYFFRAAIVKSLRHNNFR